MKKIILSSIVASIMATSASAFMGLNAEIGGGIWMPSLSGTATTTNSIDFGTANMDDKSASGNNYLYADFSHFVPVVPNIRIEKLSYNIDSKTISNSEKVDMKQTDIVAYWGIPVISTATAGVLNLNVGVDVKNFKGTINTAPNSSDKSFDETLPLLYLNTRISVPFAPVNLEATAKLISYDGTKISDNEAKMSIKLPIPAPFVNFNLDIGYKTQNVTISDKLVSGLNTNLDTKGAFFGLNAKF